MNKFESRFTSEDVEVIRRKDCHRGFLQVEQIKLRHRLHEGGWSGDLQREVMIREKAVGVLLFDPALDQLVMIRQFRIGLLGESGSPWILECVAGLIDTDETPERVAVRETEEESGLKPSELIKICEYYNSPGGSNEFVSLYCGRVDSSSAGGIFGLDQENEDIEVVVLSVDEARVAVESGVINNAMSVIAIQWLMINRDRLMESWRTPNK